MKRVFKIRRSVGIVLLLMGAVATIVFNSDAYQPVIHVPSSEVAADEAIAVLAQLPVKGRAPKTDYSREQFGGGWDTIGGCDTRNTILNRDLKDVVTNDDCQVVKGTLSDPYTGKTIDFLRGPETSQTVQIDHVVALADAWQKGAQQLSEARRKQLANDPLELLAVDGAANQEKGAGDAATWLPSNKVFRCQYIARQIAVKKKYELWVTAPEGDAMRRILDGCPGQRVPID